MCGRQWLARCDCSGCCGTVQLLGASWLCETPDLRVGPQGQGLVLSQRFGRGQQICCWVVAVGGVAQQCVGVSPTHSLPPPMKLRKKAQVISISCVMRTRPCEHPCFVGCVLTECIRVQSISLQGGARSMSRNPFTITHHQTSEKIVPRGNRKQYKDTKHTHQSWANQTACPGSFHVSIHNMRTNKELGV